MMIVKDSEWKLAEIGDGRFSFINHKDSTVRLTVRRCRYILKEMDYALNLDFVERAPSIEFTQKTMLRLSPSDAKAEIQRVRANLVSNCVHTMQCEAFSVR